VPKSYAALRGDVFELRHGTARAFGGLRAGWRRGRLSMSFLRSGKSGFASEQRKRQRENCKPDYVQLCLSK